jgi:hypothetical protein
MTIESQMIDITTMIRKTATIIDNRNKNLNDYYKIK